MAAAGGHATKQLGTHPAARPPPPPTPPPPPLRCPGLAPSNSPCAPRPKSGPKASLYLTLVGILAGFLSTFW